MARLTARVAWCSIGIAESGEVIILASRPCSRWGKAGNRCGAIRIQHEKDMRVWKWLNELSVAARLLVTFGLTVAGVVTGTFVALWVADFDDRVGALETQAEVARTERADFAEESRRRDEESLRRDEESLRRDEESRRRDEEAHQRDNEILEEIREGQEEANIFFRTIVPMIEASNAETKLYVAEEVSGVKATIEVHGLEIENLKDTEAVPESATP